MVDVKIVTPPDLGNFATATWLCSKVWFVFNTVYNLSWSKTNITFTENALTISSKTSFELPSWLHLIKPKKKQLSGKHRDWETFLLRKKHDLLFALLFIDEKHSCWF